MKKIEEKEKNEKTTNLERICNSINCVFMRSETITHDLQLLFQQTFPSGQIGRLSVCLLDQLRHRLSQHNDAAQVTPQRVVLSDQEAHLDDAQAKGDQDDHLEASCFQAVEHQAFVKQQTTKSLNWDF